MAYTIHKRTNSKKRGGFSGTLLFVFCALLTITFPAVAEYEQSLEELTDKMDLAQSTEELDDYLLKAYSGDKDAQFKLGAIYSSGESGALQDHEQSAYWYKKAAEQGHDSAQYNLGHKYLEGKGVEKDINKAIEWWEKAAKQQHELAQFNLGRAYYLGIGTKKDVEKSRHWFTQAANNNEVRSAAILRKMNWDTPSTETALSDNTALGDETALDNKTLNNQTALNETSTSTKPSTQNSNNSQGETSIAIYTNPVIKPMIITVAKSKEDINVLTEQDKWLKINSQIGLPVWTHQDFIKVNGGMGTIIGSNVNTRATPMITRGSIVGRLNKNEKVQVIEQKGEWVRILSPSRFKGWVKKQDNGFLLNPSAKVATKTTKIETTAKPKTTEVEAPVVKATEEETKDSYQTINSYYDKIKKSPPPSKTDSSGEEGEEGEENNKWQIK